MPLGTHENSPVRQSPPIYLIYATIAAQIIRSMRHSPPIDLCDTRRLMCQISTTIASKMLGTFMRQSMPTQVLTNRTPLDANIYNKPYGLKGIYEYSISDLYKATTYHIHSHYCTYAPWQLVPNLCPLATFVKHFPYAQWQHNFSI